MIYCPRCDKRITPDHRCLNRRHFFGMLAGAAALLVAPKVVPANCLTADDFGKARNILRAGDKLTVNFSALPSEPFTWTLSMEATGDVKRGQLQSTTHTSSLAPHGPIFVAPRDLRTMQ